MIVINYYLWLFRQNCGSINYASSLQIIITVIMQLTMCIITLKASVDSSVTLWAPTSCSGQPHCQVHT